MSVCEHYRIPHSQLLEWEKPDRDKAIWKYLRRVSTCSGCGTRPEEWNPAEGGHRGAYLATETVCTGCRQIEERQKWLRDQNTPTAGLHVHLKRNPKLENGGG